MDMCIKLPDWVNFVAMQAGNLTDCELCGAQFDNPHIYKYTHWRTLCVYKSDGGHCVLESCCADRRPITMHNGKNNRQSNTALVFSYLCTLQFRFMSHAKSIVRNNQNYDGLIYPAANSIKGSAQITKTPPADIYSAICAAGVINA